MTDITTTNLIADAPISFRRPTWLRIRRPRLSSILASIAAAPAALGQAAGMAYAAPYQSGGRQHAAPADQDFQGRDPRW